MKTTNLNLQIALAFLLAPLCLAQGPNVKVINTTSQPVPVNIVAGGAGGSSGTVTQGSTTSGQSGMLTQGAVTTAAPAYTTGQTSPVSLTTGGLLRTDPSGVTSPISAASLPLPTGAATSASQTTGNNSLSSIDGKMAGDTTNGNKTQVQVFKGAGNYANGQVATSTTAATLVAARATRRSVSVVNMDAAITVYIGAATVTAANGFPLKAGQSISLDTTGLVQAISASGTPNVAYFETYD